MRHKAVSLGLALLLSISLFGCGSSPSQTEPAKNTTKITEPGYSTPPVTTEPAATNPQKPTQPEAAANSVPGNPSAPADTKSTNSDQVGVTSPGEPKTPKETSLPKVPITPNVDDTMTISQPKKN